MGWLPADFVHPARVELPTGHHLRPIRAADAEIDLPAVMGSRDRLYAQYGPAWGWPPVTMTLEQDREDLAHHEQEMATGEGFNYAVLDAEEGQLFGCVYLYPAEEPDADVDVSWWVVDDAVGTDLDRELSAFVPRWITTSWPFTAPRVWP